MKKMPLYTQQPKRQVRMSGLGALASMLPALQTQGTGAFLDSDVCDFDALVQRIAGELGMKQQYRGQPALAQRDAAQYAHEIWLANCPAAQSYVSNTTNIYGGGGWWGGGGGRHRRHPRDMTAHGSHGSPPSAMALRTVPSGSSAAPMSIPHRVATQHATAMPNTAHPRMQAQGQNQMAQRRGSGPSRSTSHGMRGLGDGEQIVGPIDARTLRQGSLPRVVTPAALHQVQQMVQSQSPQATWSSTSTDIPVEGGSVMPSLSLEGALPGGVAFLLAGALGMLGASFLFGGK